MSGERDSANPLRSEALKGVKWTAVNTWVSQGLSLLVLLILARLLEPEDFGLFAIAHIVMMLVTTVANQGLSEALIQRKEIDAGHQHSVFWLSLLVSLSLALLLYLVRDPVATLFNNDELSRILPALAALPILQGMTSVPHASMTRALAFRLTAIVSIVSALTGSTTAILMALKGYGVWSLVGQHVTAAVVRLLMSWALVGWYPKPVFSFSKVREIWRFGVFMMAGNVTSQMSARIDSLFVGSLLGAHLLGLYAVGRRVVEMAHQTITSTIGQVAMPTFARMQDERPRMKTAFLNATQSLVAITYPMFGILAVLSHEFTLLFLGPKWLAGAPVLALLSIAALMVTTSWLGANALVANGRADLRFIITIVNLFTGVLLVSLAYPFGLEAVAASMVGRSCLVIGLYAYMLRKVLPMRYAEFFSAVRPVAMAIVPAMFAAYLIRTQLEGSGTLMVMATVSLCALAIYLGLLFLTTPGLIARLFRYGKEMAGRT